MSWSKHSNAVKSPFGDIKIEKDDYMKPSEYVEKYGHSVKIVGAFIVKSKKAKKPHPVVLAETPDGIKGLSLGAFCTEQWEEILGDTDDVEAIKRGEASGELEERHTDEYDKDYYVLVI